LDFWSFQQARTRRDRVRPLEAQRLHDWRLCLRYSNPHRIFRPIARPLPAIRISLRDARLIGIIGFGERLDLGAIEFARLHQAQRRKETVVKYSSGDVQPTRRLASAERRKTGQRDMHRRFGEVAALEFPLRPGEML